MAMDTRGIPAEMQPYWARLNTRFAEVERVFADRMDEALQRLSPEGVERYLDAAAFLGRMGRGAEPMLIYLEEAPGVAAIVGEDVLPVLKDFAYHLSRNTNVPSIVPFLQTTGAVARLLKTHDLFHRYLELVRDFADRTAGSVHGHHTTFSSPGLPELLKQAPRLLKLVTLDGLKNWMDYGARHYSDHPERQRDFFALQSADAHAVLQRERHGTLFIDHERQLDLYLRGLWRDHDRLVPYSLAFDELRKPMPYFDELGMRIPDVYDEKSGIAGIDRYRAALAHMAAHRRWSSKMIVDNWSPFQRLGVETFEDCRVDVLAMRRYPGLRRILLALHPVPDEAVLADQAVSTIRVRLAMLSRAILDADHPYADADVLEFAGRFHAVMRDGESSSEAMASLGLAFIARTRRQHDLLPKVLFKDTEVDYRDDNRHLWIYIENGDEEEDFAHLEKQPQQDDIHALPPRHYDEWDYTTKSYRPDWVSLHELLHPKGDAADIDRLLHKHSAVAKRMKRILDMLKPQQKVRIRFQEEGSELDLDVALRALIDYRAGSSPDPRINMSHTTAGRNIAVSLLLDLSESLGEQAAGSQQTVLELSQEAVSLLAWAIDKLGDPFAIGGFHSNTRHDVRYLHFKGFSEAWDDEVKARLAAMDSAWSTRMGAAMRHAGHYLKGQRADKKLLLILTDGQPSDIDAKDERMLIEDAHQAVNELDRDGIYTYCISLDAKADTYVSDIFGRHYTIIDHIERLPERLPELFIALTK
jgi:hypothetical protein